MENLEHLRLEYNKAFDHFNEAVGNLVKIREAKEITDEEVQRLRNLVKDAENKLFAASNALDAVTDEL